MPEGHVMHALALDLNAAFGGRPVAVTSPQGRFADAAVLVDGQSFGVADAVGKNLFLPIGDQWVVHVHLGLIGKLAVGVAGQRLFAPTALEANVRLRLCNPSAVAELRGPQVCRLSTPDEVAQLTRASGPDPLRPDADAERGWERVHRSRRSIAALLMDQRVAAGVGNIFRAEVLFRHRVNPDRPGNQLTHGDWTRLWHDLVVLMGRAVEARRIDSVFPEHEPTAQGRPPRVDRHGGEVYVYRRAGQPCLVCGTPVAKRALEGRNLYWCPRCQA